MTDRPDIQAQAMCRELRQEGYLVPYPAMVKAMQAAALRPEAQGVNFVQSGKPHQRKCAVIGLEGQSFLVGVYPDRPSAEKAVSGRSDVWTIFEQATPQERPLPSGAMWVQTLAPSAFAPDRPEAQDGLVKAAKALRAAQVEYMNDRGNEAKGARVGEAARHLDAVIAEAEIVSTE